MQNKILKSLAILFIVLLSSCNGVSFSNEPQSSSSEISFSEHSSSQELSRSQEINSSESQISSSEISFSEHSSSQESSSVHVHLPGEPVKENIIEADCVNEGSYEEVIYCKSCGEEISRTSISIPSLNHRYELEKYIWDDCYHAYAYFVCQNDSSHTLKKEMNVVKEVINESTCLDEGQNIYHASLNFNNQNYQDDREGIDKPLGHDYGDWQIVKESDELNEGIIRKTCHRCSSYQEETLPKTSLFNFKLSGDNSYYIVFGFNNDDPSSPYAFLNGIKNLYIPKTYNNLPIKEIYLVLYLDSFEQDLRIFVDKSITTIEITFYQFNDLIGDQGKNTTRLYDLYYFGDLNDYINNYSKGRCTDYMTYRLHLFDENNQKYHLLDELILPEGVTQINNYQFSGLLFKKLVCPSSLKRIGIQAFYKNYLLKEVSLNEGLTTIDGLAFGNTGIEEIVLPSTLISDKSTNQWFGGCSNLLSIVIKEGANIKEKQVGGIHTVKIIDYTNGGHAPLKGVYISKENMNESDIFKYQDFIFAKINGEFYLIKYDGRDTNITLPNQVIYQNELINEYRIYEDAFKNGVVVSASSSIASFTIDDAFRKPMCFSDRPIEEIHFSKAVKEIMKNSFTNCFLKNVYFDGVYENLIQIVSKSIYYEHQSMILTSFQDFSQSSIYADNIIYYLDENNQYLPLDLSNIYIE